MSGELVERLDDGCVHVCVDMQRLFAEPTVWHAPALHEILPAVTRLCALAPGRSLFTRFLTPAHAGQACGSWRRYYHRWADVTLQRMDPAMLDLVEPLAAFVPPASVCDKTTHSAFNSGPLREEIAQRAAHTLVVSGVETDVCVLATILDAVDLGYAVIVARDAVAGSNAASHQAVLDQVLPRLEEQVQLASVDVISSNWSRR